MDGGNVQKVIATSESLEGSDSTSGAASACRKHSYFLHLRCGRGSEAYNRVSKRHIARPGSWLTSAAVSVFPQRFRWPRQVVRCQEARLPCTARRRPESGNTYRSDATRSPAHHAPQVVGGGARILTPSMEHGGSRKGVCCHRRRLQCHTVYSGVHRTRPSLSNDVVPGVWCGWQIYPTNFMAEGVPFGEESAPLCATRPINPCRC